MRLFPASLIALLILGIAVSPIRCLGQDVDFAKQIQPILKKYCAGCHNEDDMEGDFSVHDYESIQSGEGEVYIAGDADESFMMQMILGEVEPVMPPEDQARPNDKEVALLAKWINEGANGPATPKATKRPSAMKKPELETPKLTPDANLKSPITSVDWSAQNDIAISRFQTVEVFHAKNDERRRTFAGFPGKINSVRFYDGGQKLLIASGVVGVSGSATLIDTDTGKTVAEVNGHSDTLYDAVLSPDGKWVATAGYDKRILIWDAKTGESIRELKGHNDAIYCLEFSTNSATLISASGDQTIKVWDVETGQRLETFGQPLKEQLVTGFDRNRQLIVGAGRDNRIRVWKFDSNKKSESSGSSELVISRFAHEAPIVDFAFSKDGSRLVTSSEDLTIKIWNTEGYHQVGTIGNQPDVCSSIAISPDGSEILVGRMDGSFARLKVPAPTPTMEASPQAIPPTPAGSDSKKAESSLEKEPNNDVSSATRVDVPTKVTAKIFHSNVTDVDYFHFNATVDQPLIIETKSLKKSGLDTRIKILNENGEPIPRVLLRAVRDSYFTFRGKNSEISDDFRVHNWEEMNLNEYLYSSGEVVKLFLHPRGPDSGFKVYPGYGKRYTYFGTTAGAHSLHEPCYIVRPFPVGTEFQPNGLPVFTVNYENDDDPLRKKGKDSRLTFVPPKTGTYFVAVSDIRGESKEDFEYELTIRSPKPDFGVRLAHKNFLHQGSCQEFSLTADRSDDFTGPITVAFENVPNSLLITSPLIIEGNHNKAFGTVQLKPESTHPTQEEIEKIKIVATASIGNSSISRPIKGFGEIEFKEQPKVQIRIGEPDSRAEQLFSSGDSSPLVFEVEPGTKLQAKVFANRLNHKNRISFGNEDSGRNLPHGVYVSDIGLNGLMITKDKDEQVFFITVEDWVQPTTRTFHVRAHDVDGIASLPVTIRILEKRIASTER